MKKKTIRELKDWLQTHQLSASEWAELQQDSRIGVQKLLATYERKREKEKREQARLEKMWEWEKKCYDQGYQAVAGVDEAGRGPLAGPVVAAAVILPLDFDVTGMNDSKLLTAEDRQQIKERIERNAVGIGIGIVDAEYIDRQNILQATLHAMRLAVEQLKPQVDYLLIDALKIPALSLPQQQIIKGDQLSHSIAAASIIAKTTRDEWMEEAAKQYPNYLFAQHKGYGTAEHLNKIKQWGPSPIHRRSFAPLRDWFPQVK